MIRLAHIVNPVIMPATSDLTVAQPITFESMRIARQFAHGKVDVSLLTTQYPEDRSLVPPDFTPTPDLERSVLDLGEFEKPRKLPLLRDILDRLYENSDADYLIYTNVDIALMPNFYAAVGQLIDAGHDAFTINRRTISDRYSKPGELPLMYAEIGDPHPGNDCFVFKREAYPQYLLSDTSIGAKWIGRTLLMNLYCNAERFRKYRDQHLSFHVGKDRVWKDARLNDYSVHNRNCALSVARELMQNHEGLERDREMAKYLKDLGLLTRREPPSARLKQYLKRKLSLAPHKK